MTSIVVIQFRFMGDLIMGFSLLDNLRQSYPQAQLTLVSDAGNAALLSLRPDVRLIPYPRQRRGRRSLWRGTMGWLGVVRAIRVLRAEILIDCSNSRSGAFLSVLSGVPTRIGYRPYKWIPARAYTEFASDWGRGRHTVDRFLSPLDSLGLPIRTREPRMRPSPVIEARIADLLADRGLRPGAFVAVHLGARVLGRQWPRENFARVVDDLVTRHGLRTAIVGGPDESESAASFVGLCDHAPVNLVGALAPAELSAVLTHCRFFLGNDSGPMHVAAASGAKVVALFGLQSPERWAPLGEGHIIVRPSMPCPCPFPEVCRPPDPQATYCVRRITVDEVLGAVDAMLSP